MSTFEEVKQDQTIYKELIQKVEDGYTLEKASQVGVTPQMVKAIIRGDTTGEDPAFSRPFTEAVVMEFMRPCLVVRNDTFEIPESDEWKMRLEPFRRMIEQRIPSVGRVELKFHPRYNWCGTAWLIDEEHLVTNRHVASLFAAQNGSDHSYVFLPNEFGGTIQARVDFKEEHAMTDPTTAIEIGIRDVIYISRNNEPDIAFLKLDQKMTGYEPVPISTRTLKGDDEIVVIGYPAYDPYRNPLKPGDVERIFGNVFDVKRVSPGKIMVPDFAPWCFTHDATTLGGNSGSAIIDYKTGHAIGLHFKGVFHEGNYAVNGATLLDYLSRTSITIPDDAASIRVATIPAPENTEENFIDEAEEATPQDYNDREGYLEDFIGTNVIIPLPIIANTSDVLKYTDTEGLEQSELKYQHFSVAMSATRRLCYYSAVNIDGKNSKRKKRTSWRYDPRIPRSAQIKGECYGNPPKFSRGHMTRREDPVWGTDAAASRGNDDSMHVTNSVPQMQPFNAGIWLELENYALENARQDDMHISVFTGPFLMEDDPDYYGVQVPVEFWKVIAFIHDETGLLTATGYVMSQEGFLGHEEYIYGQFKTYQTTLKSIGVRAGLSFGELAEADPYEGFEIALSPLTDLSQILFIK